jgi:DNA-binding NtrC family response regulator
MSRPRALVIDPNANAARDIARLCQSAGFDTVCAADLSEAEAADLVASDIAFVDAGFGIDVLQQLAAEDLADTELFATADTEDTQLAEQCVRAGYSFFLVKPVAEQQVAAVLSDIAAEVHSDMAAGETESPEAGSTMQFGLLRGSAKGMRKLFRTLRKVAPTDTSVLVVGESGTGKELVAETLHQLSNRSDAPYLTVNCAAIAENLIESELFGHEKGSFSGAHKAHSGFFERANGGTLFLDEVTEMAAETQAKLLRVLESGQVRRVGGAQPIDIDVRIVAATNRDPQRAVTDGVLREDLFYRLAHISLHLPPLRRRAGDKVGLALHFLRQLNERHGTALSFSDDAVAAINAFEWPGNVRELRHAVERAYILSDDVIREADLALQTPGPDVLSAGDITLPFGMSIADAERRIILANLEHNEGDKPLTAEQLGISLKTLYNRLSTYEADDG